MQDNRDAKNKKRRTWNMAKYNKNHSNDTKITLTKKDINLLTVIRTTEAHFQIKLDNNDTNFDWQIKQDRFFQDNIPSFQQDKIKSTNPEDINASPDTYHTQARKYNAERIKILKRKTISRQTVNVRTQKYLETSFA